jgi:hypothetical protein
VVWDPFGTLISTLWITGGQWAGKSTVARILARRHGLTAYHYDYHDARGHEDRRIAERVRRGELPDGPSPDARWVDATPEEMAAATLAGFPERFAWALDDLRGLVSGRPLLAEGWGLRPELVAPVARSTEQVIVMVPTEEFRRHQLSTLERAAAPPCGVRDPERAQHNRVERDKLVAADAVRSATELGIRVLEVDGSVPTEGVADLVAEHFGLVAS